MLKSSNLENKFISNFQYSLLTLVGNGLLLGSVGKKQTKKQEVLLLNDKSEAVAKSLRVLRAMTGKSQSAVAKEVGIPQTTLSHWERFGGMTLYNAIRMADYYGVGLDELAGRRG